ncbi:MAG: energy-coupling factor ABC transporter ATP-binding protein [Spirochaetes bacterium]|nr:energy-coupling factor ABC transporter ATP-binding protein [Spirochaetota bacterium]
MQDNHSMVSPTQSEGYLMGQNPNPDSLDIRCPDLETRNLTYMLPSGVKALCQVSISFYKGEFVLLAGRNGSGKTLLARQLVGLLRPTEGSVLFRGVPLPRCLDKARQKVGLVFQDADSQVLGQTIEEELRFGPENLGVPEEEIQRRVETVIRLLDLEQNLLTPPDRLSGGEKRRLAIGGILTIQPELLILDEPFANLDYPGIVSVLHLLLQLKEKGIGIILITHELEKALAHADRLVILEKGRIVEDGTVQTIAPRAGQYGLHPLDFSRTPLESCTWLPR